jgi:hypothetical protein
MLILEVFIMIFDNWDSGTGIQRKGAKKQRRQMERQFAGEADGIGDNRWWHLSAVPSWLKSLRLCTLASLR